MISVFRFFRDLELSASNTAEFTISPAAALRESERPRPATFGIISGTLSGYGNRQVQMALRLKF
jgi:hypothetical protein